MAHDKNAVVRLAEKKTRDDYYRLARKIIKSGVLSDKDAAGLAVMFSDAAHYCHGPHLETESRFAKLLDLGAGSKLKARR